MAGIPAANIALATTTPALGANVVAMAANAPPPRSPSDAPSAADATPMVGISRCFFGARCCFNISCKRLAGDDNFVLSGTASVRDVHVDTTLRSAIDPKKVRAMV